jgi:hypothetical protein
VSAQTVQVSINLGALQSSSLRRLQQLTDVLKFARAAAAALTPDDFDQHLDFFNLRPSANTALGFDQAREASETWVVLHILRDAIDVIQAFLEDVHRCCALYQLVKKHSVTSQDFQLFDAAADAFHSLGLPVKIKRLRDMFGVESDFDQHIVSLNTARNCLVHRLGTVGESDVDSNGELRIKWAEIRLQARALDGSTVKAIDRPTQFDEGWTVELVIGPKEKVYGKGDQLHLTYQELLGALFSHQSYINSLTVSVQKYAETLGFAFVPPSTKS